MYGPMHPFYARHLMLEQAYLRTATRESRSAVVPNHPPVRRTRPVRPRTPITWFVAPLVTALLGVSVVVGAMAVDPSETSQSAHLRYDLSPTTCTAGGVKLRWVGPCPTTL